MDNNKFSILYVDDEESNLRIFKNIFKKEYIVFTALSAKEGIEILEKEQIDLIISDQRMPETSGVEFLKYTLKEHPDLNRILITGYTDFNALKSAINEAKIFQYVQKPWKENDLSNIIREALGIYKLEQENRELITKLKTANTHIEKTNSELKEVAERLKREKENAVESDRLKSVFLSNISHEVRTPMNGIIGFSELILDADLTFEKRVEYIQIIIRSCNRLLKIIDDIVEVSKFETKQVKIHYSEIEIHKFFQDIRDISKTKLTSENIDIILNDQIPSDIESIVSDEAKLEKIVGNLVENAIKFTYEGYIEITCSLAEKNLLVSVKDTGIGIEEKVQETIFERFRQADENVSRLFDGLGLGLSIVKDNIDIIGGEIEVSSEKGKGAVFSCKVPIYIADDDPFANEGNSYNLDSDEIFANKQVLIVEDDNINYYYLSTLIKNTVPGMSVFRVDNGKDAVDFMRENTQIKIIFMDMKMPVMNGFDATEEIKKFAQDVIVIAQTAYVSEEFKERAIACGCAAVIEKPIRKTDVTDILKAHFEFEFPE